MISILYVFFLLVLLVLIFIIFLLTFYMVYNEILLEAAIKFNRLRIGARVNYIARKDGKGVWCYLKRGEHQLYHKKKYPVMVFVHGIGTNKDSWITIWRKIPSNYVCIAIDLPGHGETSFIESIDRPNLDSYISSVREFLEVMNLSKQKIYLIGISFGGAISGLFAQKYPECLERLALLCPAMKTPKLSEAHQKILKNDYSDLIPVSGNHLIKIINYISNRNQYMPIKMMNSYFNKYYSQERRKLFEKILDDLVIINHNYQGYIEKVRSIKTPTMIIWGIDDKIIDVSGAQILKENIENCQLHLFENCNHALFQDAPRKTANKIIGFLN